MKLLIYSISGKWRGAILMLALLLATQCSALLAQSLHKPGEFAVVFSENKQTGVAVRKGMKVFNDKTYVFAQVPEYLSGMDYLLTSMDSANRIIPVTEGYIYMITPLTGNEGSQAAQLIEKGFKQTDHASFSLFKEQKGKVGVFSKYITFEKFRLGHIRYEGWSVPFFKNRALPSVSIPAIPRWMPGDSYSKDARKWQGCPSIEITGSRLWGSWFSGGNREPDTGNYGIVSYSDDGRTWIDPALIIAHPDTNVRVMDSQLWKDPDGRLWVFWTQNYGRKGFDGVWGTWAMFTAYPEVDNPQWSKPVRIGDGLTRNKPVVLSGGEWLLPSYNWITHQSAVYSSKDKGKSWSLKGGPINKPVDNFYEHMCVELKDGAIWMLQRDIQQSISKDRGSTWSPLDSLTGFTSANSRLFISRLRSGRLLLIYNNDADKKRRNLTAFLSGDDGKTWPYQLMIDERENVSYPDAVQDTSDRIYVCYDRSRTGAKEILLATFTEEDIIRGEFISDFSEKKIVISKPASKN